MELEKSMILTRIARLIAGGDAGRPLTWRLAEAGRVILGTDGVSLTLEAATTERLTVAATDDVAARLEQLQDVCSQGPCWDAQLTGDPQDFVLTGDVGDRWPQFTPAAFAAVGARRLISLAMHPQGQIIGALSAHLSPGTALAVDLGSAQFMADAIGAALLLDPLGAAGVGEGAEPAGPWSGRVQVQQATGMVIAQLSITAADALALLRAHAFAHNSTVDRIAEQVLDRTLVFRKDDA